MTLLEAAAQALKDAVEGARVKVTGYAREGSEIHVSAVVPQGRLVARVEALTTLRIPELLGRLAKGALEFGQVPDDGTARKLVMVAVPRASENAYTEAARFMGEHAPQMGWAVFDRCGAVRIVVPNMLDLRRDADHPRAAVPRRSARLFTDLNCWMLKILLLRDSPKLMWSGPRVAVRNPHELFRVAEVSRELAYRFVRSFAAEDYLRETPAGLQVTRRRSLVEAWISDRRLTAVQPTPVRWIMGKPKRIQDVFTPKTAGDFVMAGFSACRKLGVLHTAEPRTEIYSLNSIDDALTTCALEPCDERDAHFFLVQARARESIARGCVTVEGMRAVDVLQAALDVANQPARGREQADFILNHVLGWNND